MATTRAFQTGQFAALASMFRGYIDGLILSAAGGTATFGIAAGIAADSTQADMLSNASAFTKTTAAWAAGSGNGALDTGSIAASTWYHAYIIKNKTTRAVDFLVSLSASVPTLPSGYTLSRRIGSMRTDGSSNWTAFTQVGDYFYWSSQVLDVNNTTQGTTATNYTVSTPLGVQCLWFGSYGAANTSNQGTARAYATAQADQASGSGNAAGSGISLTQTNVGANRLTVPSYPILTNTSSQIRAVASETEGQYFCIQTNGWIDQRGKNS